MIKEDAILIPESEIPGWINISGLNNRIEIDSENLSAIKALLDINGGTPENSYAEIKLNLVDTFDNEIKDTKTIRIAIDKTIVADISYPFSDSLVRADVPIFGNAYGEDFAEYTLKYGAGLDPEEWIIITNSTEEMTYDNVCIEMSKKESGHQGSRIGNLGTWRVGLTAYEFGTWPVDLNGIYTVRLEVKDKTGKMIADEVVLHVGRVITAGGGEVESPDEKVNLSFKPFSIGGSQGLFSIDKAAERFTKQLADKDLKIVGDIYEVRKPGRKFDIPILLEMEYSEENLDIDGDSHADIAEEDISVFYYNTFIDKWTSMGGNVNYENNNVSVQINFITPKFAFYALGEDPYPPEAPVIEEYKETIYLRNTRISGKSEAGIKVKILVNGNIQKEVQTGKLFGNFSTLITNLNVGDNVVTARAIDNRGRESEDSEPAYIEFYKEFRMKPLSIVSELKFMNADYKSELTRDVNTGYRLNIELVGNDSNPDVENIAVVKISSSMTDPEGIEIDLIETGINTGIYRRSVLVSSSSSRFYQRIAAGHAGEIIRVVSVDDESKKDEVKVKDNLAPTPPKVYSTTHPSVMQDTFEIDLGNWINKEDEDGAELILDKLEYNTGEYSLKLLNENEGGYFSAYVFTNGFEAKEYQEISFDYKIEKKIKVNIILEMDGEMLGIQFTDDNHNGWEGVQIIDSLPIINDNQWRSVNINIYDILNKYKPGQESYYVKEMMFADVSSGGCGTFAAGKNAKGVYYNIDNFIISKVMNSRDVKINLEASWDGSGIIDYSYVLDNNKNTIPDTAGEGLIEEIDYTGLSDGTYYFHVRAKDGNDNWGNNTSYRIKIDATGPIASDPFPADGTLSGSEKITLKISDNSEGGIYAESIRLSVEGTEYRITDRELSYDHETELLTFKPSYPSTIIFADKQQIECTLLDVSDRAGNHLETEYNWDWKYSVPDDHYMPHPPPVILSPADNEISTGNVTIEWDCYDLSGIKNYSYVLSREIGTEPDEIGEGPAKTITYSDLEDGIYYFNIKAQDENDNWDGVTHYPLYINVPGDGEIYYVNNETGSDDNDGLTWGTALKTIQAGVDKCKDNLGNKIYVMATEMPYTGEVYVARINKSGKDAENMLEIRSYSEEEGKRAELDLENKTLYGFDITGKYILVEGFEIHSGMEQGIKLNFAENCIIKNNKSHDNRVSGILLRDSSYNNQIISNECYNNRRYGGIFLRSGSKYNVLEGNICRNNNVNGIYIGNYSAENEIVNNQLYKQQNGIYLVKCYENTISRNNVYSNIKGVYLNDNCEANKVSQNICYGNKGDGINVSDDCSHNSIISNDCYRNDKGISIRRYCENNNIEENNIRENISYSIEMRNRCNGNEISENIVEDNSGYGIYVEEYCDENELEENIIRNNQSAGIVLYAYCMENEIVLNESSKNKLGIRIEDNCKENKIIGNVVEENISHGVKVYNNSGGTEIEGNKVERNGKNGIYIESYCSDNNVVNNEVADNDLEGVWIKEECNNNNITGNTFNGNAAGLWIEGSLANNNIEKNEIEGNKGSGIHLVNNCNGSRIEDNKIRNNEKKGIIVRESCRENVITGNEVTGNNIMGIAIQNQCNENEITSNICNKNNAGINLSGNCEGNEISLNMVKENTTYGINVYDNCSGNKIESNNSSDNKGYGINIEENSSGNMVLKNVVTNNQSYGIRLAYSSINNEIVSNECSKNKIGMIMSILSGNNKVLDNKIKENKLYGLNIKNSSGNEICRNEIRGNVDDGINIINKSSDNEIENNEITGNGFDGMEMAGECHNNVIRQNRSYDNNKAGLKFDSCNGNEIRENASYNNGSGLYMSKSDDNLVQENEFYANNNSGMMLVKTKKVSIYKNNVYMNQTDGLYLHNADETDLRNSTFYKNGIGINIKRLSDKLKMYNVITRNNSYYGVMREGNKLKVYYNNINDTYKNIVLETGNITSDPLFRDENNNEFQLKYNSPAMDSGENGAAMGRYTITVKQQEFRSISDYVIRFKTSPIGGSIPGDGHIRIELPGEFDISKVSGAESSTMDGDFSISFEGNTIIARRVNGSATISGGVEELRIKELEIHSAGTGFALKLETRDKAGNVIDIPEVSNDFEVKYDNSAPVTTLSMAEGVQYISGDKIYASEDTKFVLTAEDILTAEDSFASGVDYVEYIIDNSDWIRYSSEFTLTEGIHTIYYRSCDKLGNVEEIKEFKVRIDGTAPHTDMAIGEPKYTDVNIYITSDTPISLTAFDPEINGAASGVKVIEYKIQDTWQEYSTPFVVEGADGVYEIYYRSRDNVENTEESKLQEIVLDNTAPAIPVNLVGYVENNVNISLYWEEVISTDLAGYNVYDNGTKLNAGPVTEETYELSGMSYGTHSFTVSSIDLVGNESDQSIAYVLTLDNSIIITRPVEGEYFRKMLKVIAEINLEAKKSELTMEYGDSENPGEWLTIKEFKNWPPSKDQLIHPWQLWIEDKGDEIPLNGEYRLRIRVVNNEGERENTRIVMVDNESPETEIKDIVEEEGDRIYINNELMFEAIDPEINGIASGIKYTKYRLESVEGGDSFSWVEWDGEAIGLEEGEYNIWYYSADNAKMWMNDNKNFSGNVEETNYNILVVESTEESGADPIAGGPVIPGGEEEEKQDNEEADTIAPVIEITGVEEDKHYREDVTVDVSIEDENLKSSSMILNGMPFESGSIVAEENNHNLRADAEDEAGNKANESVEFTIDKTAPEIIFAIEDGETYYNEVLPGLRVIEENINILEVKLRYINALTKLTERIDWKPGTTITTANEYELEVMCIDKAGNKAREEIRFKLDIFEPEEVLIFRAEYNESEDADKAGGSAKNHSGAKITTGSEGKEGEALPSYFNGNSRYARYKAEKNIDIEQGTIMMWVKPFWESAEQEGTDQGRHLFTLYNGEDEDFTMRFAVYKGSGTTVYIKTEDEKGEEYIIPFSVDTSSSESDRWYKDGAEKWTHLSLSWDSEGCIKVHIDGELSGKKIVSKWKPINIDKNSWIKIGDSNKEELGQEDANGDSYTEFHGYIDRLKIYSKSLIDKQIKVIYETENIK